MISVRRIGACAAFVVSFILVVWSADPAWAAAGDLDPSWGAAGFVVTPFPPDDSFGEGVIARGNEVIATGPVCGSDCDFGLAKYNYDGTLDTSFGTLGEVTTNITTDDVATAIAYQSSDKIVVVGYTTPDFVEFDFAVARYNKDGSLDTSFDGDGIVTTDFAGSEDIADAVVIKGDKIIVAGGTTAGGGGENFGLVRYNKDGSLDTSFGDDGKVVTDFNDGFDAANGVEVMENRILATGYVCATTGSFSSCSASGRFDFGLTRYRSNGSLDSSFGAGGKVETDFDGDNDYAHAADVRGQQIVAVGSAASSGSDQDFAAAEYKKSGALDSSFGGDGKAAIDMGGDDEALGAAFQYDGRVVAAGYTSDATSQFAVARWTSSGDADPSFGGGDGYTTTPIGSDSAAQALALGPDNRIVAAGYTCNAVCNFAVARYLAN